MCDFLAFAVTFMAMGSSGFHAEIGCPKDRAFY
jgi:hypothetical protein